MRGCQWQTSFVGSWNAPITGEKKKDQKLASVGSGTETFTQNQKKPWEKKKRTWGTQTEKKKTFHPCQW